MNQVTIDFNSKKTILNYRDEADVSVLREIFKVREYRAAEEVIKAAIEPIIDAGAHAGYFTLYCRALNPKVKIFAVEPEKNNLEILAKNLKDNEADNVKVIAGAIAGATGKRGLVISADSHNHHLGQGSDTSVWALGDLFKINKIKQVALLKMDIEGAEYEVLGSLAAEEYKMIKAIILEYHNGAGRDGEEVEVMLRQNGFGVQVFPSKFDKTMGIIFGTNKRSDSRCSSILMF